MSVKVYPAWVKYQSRLLIAVTPWSSSPAAICSQCLIQRFLSADPCFGRLKNTLDAPCVELTLHEMQPVSLFRCPRVVLEKKNKKTKNNKHPGNKTSLQIPAYRILILVGVASSADLADSSGLIVTKKAAFTPRHPLCSSCDTQHRWKCALARL